LSEKVAEIEKATSKKKYKRLKLNIDKSEKEERERKFKGSIWNVQEIPEF